MTMESLADFRARIRTRCRRSLECGDTVRDIHDERHTGSVVAFNQSTVIVRWPNGWQSDIPIERVRRVPN